MGDGLLLFQLHTFSFRLFRLLCCFPLLLLLLLLLSLLLLLQKQFLLHDFRCRLLPALQLGCETESLSQVIFPGSLESFAPLEMKELQQEMLPSLEIFPRRRFHEGRRCFHRCKASLRSRSRPCLHSFSSSRMMMGMMMMGMMIGWEMRGRQGLHTRDRFRPEIPDREPGSCPG